MGRKPNDGQDNTTCPEGRVSTSTRFSEEVSDGACPKANHTTRQITRTPAQTILESQEANVERLDLIWQVMKSRDNGWLEYSKKKVVGELRYA